MTKLNEVQIALLTAASMQGGAPAIAYDHRTTAALMRRGFLTAEDRKGGETWLVATADGLSAAHIESDTTRAVEPAQPQLQAAGPSPAGGSKANLLRSLLEQPDGATVAEMAQAAGWMPHSVRGFMAGALKKKLGFGVVSEKTETGRRYRLAADRVVE